MMLKLHNRYKLGTVGALSGVIIIGVIDILKTLPSFGTLLTIVMAAVFGCVLSLYGGILRQNSIIDDGTGLFNRRYLFHRLDTEWKRKATSGMSISVAVIDVDDFRQYNNQYGHLEGDKVLKTIANTLKANLRKSDIICRWGGEEFAVVLPKSTAEEVHFTAERLRQAINGIRLELNSHSDIGVSISIGITTCNSEDESSELLMKRADKAMYEAKRHKNKVVQL
jgi:diguanylate cyclase (GGDEF)-like protein